ncbi:MAG: hypothetical protein F4Y03_14695 [Alphaproteobacteria bacterium]|nr:hypothetical protein [Alphaproteobacteria bacterium]
MKTPLRGTDRLVARAGRDSEFRDRLLANPKEAIEEEFGVTVAGGQEVHVHEETGSLTHIVLPPRDKFTAAEREEAKTGAESLDFLRRTMHDPAPPFRPPAPQRRKRRANAATAGTLAKAGREAIRRSLLFLDSAIDENGAWHCIRFNTANPDIPRHFERPPFVSALCALALESCDDDRAVAMRMATGSYLIGKIEYPGLWRYYRHLPQDLDSTALCSLAIGDHPWILLERNVPRLLDNRDENGRFMTWILDDDEPDVVSRFRLEADPVVNANVIAYLGDRPETRAAQQWLETLIAEGSLDGSSKWYPDEAAIHYAAARAVARVQPALDRMRPALANRILNLRDEEGEFANILQAALAVAALFNIGSLERIDAKRQLEGFIIAQQEDGSWPEILAFGDQSLKWGTVGQIGHGSDTVTSAFCVEAVERLLAHLEA